MSEAPADTKDGRGAAIGHDFVERTTLVVAADGTIAAVIGGVGPADNVEAALVAVRKLVPAPAE